MLKCHVILSWYQLSDLFVSCIFWPALHVLRCCVFRPALGWLVLHCYILSQYLTCPFFTLLIKVIFKVLYYFKCIQYFWTVFIIAYASPFLNGSPGPHELRLTYHKIKIKCHEITTSLIWKYNSSVLKREIILSTNALSSSCFQYQIQSNLDPGAQRGHKLGVLIKKDSI